MFDNNGPAEKENITTELLPGRIRLLQDGRHLRIGADAVLLAAFCPPAERICELGCGVGNVLLALAGRQPYASLVGVEIEPGAAELCRESIRLNSLESRVHVETGDLREAASLDLAPRSFDLVLMNPPYLRAGTVRDMPDPVANLERVDVTAPPEAVARAAAYLLRARGSLCLILRAGRLGDYISAVTAAGLAPAELCLAAHDASAPPSLALLRAEKGYSGELQILPTFRMGGEEYRRILEGAGLREALGVRCRND